jgi:hypothetical protein
VWSRNSGGRRRRGNPLVGLLVTLLALFGAVTAVLGIKERSVAEGGAIVDSWIATGWAYAQDKMGRSAAVEPASAPVAAAPAPTATPAPAAETSPPA